MVNIYIHTKLDNASIVVAEISTASFIMTEMTEEGSQFVSKICEIIMLKCVVLWKNVRDKRTVVMLIIIMNLCIIHKLIRLLIVKGEKLVTGIIVVFIMMKRIKDSYHAKFKK